MMTPEYVANLTSIANAMKQKKGGMINEVEKVLEIEISKITPDPNQPRKTFDEEALKELSEDIKQNGLIQPILVRHDKETLGNYIVIAGERRLRACTLAGLSKIRALLNSTYTPEYLGYIQISENMKRDDLKFYEMAEFIISKVEAGEKQATVAEKLGMTKQQLHLYMIWATAPDYLKEVKESFSSIRTFYDLAKLSEEHENEVMEFILSRDDSILISRAEITALKKSISAPDTVSNNEAETTSDNERDTAAETTSDNERDTAAETTLAPTTDTESETSISDDTDNGSDTNTEDTYSQSEDNQEDTASNRDNPFGDDPFASNPFSSDSNISDTDESDNSFSSDSESDVKDETDTLTSDTAFSGVDTTSNTTSNSEDLLESAEDNLLTEEKQDTFKKPVIIGTVSGREAELLFKSKPTTDAMVVVKYEDGSIEEVLAEDFVINRIFEA